MMISYCWRSNSRINILASGHSDGRFGAIVGKYFGLNNIPLLQTINQLPSNQYLNYLKFKVHRNNSGDGPRGPNQKVSDGIIKIAKQLRSPSFLLVLLPPNLKN